MTTASGTEGSRPRPVVAVLVAHWESRTEEGWITRQVAGALACAAEVHVITPEGTAPHSSTDSVFAVHRLGTPVQRSAELRRDLLVQALLAAPPGQTDPWPAEVTDLLDHDLVDCWAGASNRLAALRPDLVLIADHRNVGALAAVDRFDEGVPVALLALGSDAQSLAFSRFDPLLRRARPVLTITESERGVIVGRRGGPENVHRIGAPLAANLSALSEPNPWVGPTEYVLVLTDTDSTAEDEENDLSRLVRLSFPDRPVGIASRDGFFAWHEGRLNTGWPVERSSDLARLLAFAGVTVDLHPGGLFARRCVDSLLYGTPIVVPHDSRAREHAKRGRGGLWFANPAELVWCVESLLEPEVHDSLSAQGRAYAEEEYGSTDRFIERVTEACGLTLAADGAAVPVDSRPDAATAVTA
jgi:hypothetical protein